MGFLDLFRRNPMRAERRAVGAAAFQQVRAAYDGANRSRRSSGWRVVSTDSNAEIGTSGARLRDVARDMVRNVPLAARAKTLIPHNAVGDGIIPSIRGRTARKEQVDALLRAHLDTTSIDAGGQMTLYGIQDLAVATVVESGECIIRRRWRRASDNLPLPFQLQLLEPDHIDTTVDGIQPNGNMAVQGIEFDLLGRRVAYWLYDQHPGAWSIYQLATSRRIPAQDVAHVYRIDRPGQVRGVSWFAPVIMRMRDLADASDAHLMRFKIAACFAAFITGREFDGTDEEDIDGAPLEELGPGLVEYLNEGEDVKFGTPPLVGDYDPYTKAVMYEIAAGLGVTFEALTGRLDGVNFSSGRMGWLEFHRNVRAWQNHMIIPQICFAVQRWSMEAIALQTGSTEPLEWGWTPPRREMISPKDEIPAIRDAIRSGLSSRSEELRKLGYDPDVIDRENEEDNARADRAGLSFDSDGRRPQDGGAPQTQDKANAKKPAP